LGLFLAFVVVPLGCCFLVSPDLLLIVVVSLIVVSFASFHLVLIPMTPRMRQRSLVRLLGFRRIVLGFGGLRIALR